MPELLCEIWEDPDSLSYDMGPVSERSDQLRAAIGPNSVLRHSFFAASMFEAFQKNYDWHGWGQWDAGGYEAEPFTDEEAAIQQRYLQARPSVEPFRSRRYAIKAEVADPAAETFVFTAQKTMYGGKQIARGDTVYVFASEDEGGQGLIARGVVASAEALEKPADADRWTPRVSVTIWRSVTAKQSLGRRELKPFKDWNDGRPETELNFKYYRQATNKIVGLSDAAAVFLDGFF